ncbi:MAG TPA: LuxR C-terminal-related transcriptional regulator, partial [Motilibacteraceae bacterium]|nr:LuxR C-terminal-related transcriptional regulator [Motilibacteraceae bacterium]
MSRVAVVEDHTLLGESLRLALTARGLEATRLPLERLGSLDSLLAALTADAGAAAFDVVLLDLDLADLGRGDDLVAPLTRSGAKVLVVTGDGSPERWVGCLDRGAVAVLPKSTPLDQLVAAVGAASDGREVLARAEVDRLRQQAREAAREREARLAPFAVLSPRETEVLRALAQGRHVAEIASEAVVSEATVRAQVRAVL